MLSTRYVRTALRCQRCCQQVWNKMLATCNNLVNIIRLVARLFQQYSHDITLLLQPCTVELVTFLLYRDCIRLVRTTWLQQLGITSANTNTHVKTLKLLQICSQAVDKFTRKNLVLYLVASLPISRQQVVFALLVPSYQQV